MILKKSAQSAQSAREPFRHEFQELALIFLPQIKELQ